MIGIVRRLAPCLVLAAVLAAPGAQAQALGAAPAPAIAGSLANLAESELQARHIVAVLLTNIRDLRPALDFGMDKGEEQIKAEAAKSGPTGQLAYDRLGYWFRLFGDASWDELASDEPKFERVLVPYMTKHFSVEELRALSALLDDPAFADVHAFLLTKIIHPDQNAALSRRAMIALRHFGATAGGGSFMVKMKALPKDPDFEPLGLDLIAAWAPGAARRWGEKAEAAEAARTAAKAAGSAPN